MPDYLHPGVYIAESSLGAQTIAGVPTGTAGFVGPTERGPATPMLVTSWQDYQSWYGSTVDPSVSFLPFAVEGFFQNGGQRLFVARAIGTGATASTISGVGGSFDVSAIGGGRWGDRLRITVDSNVAAQDSVSPTESTPFQVTVRLYASVEDATNAPGDSTIQPELVEEYDNVNVLEGGRRNVVTVINAASRLVRLIATGTPMSRPTGMPFDALLTGGAEGKMDADSFTGASSVAPDLTGLAALESIREFAILACPDAVNSSYTAFGSSLIQAMVTQAETMKNRFVVTDVIAGQRDVNTIYPPVDTSYGAVYYPWIHVLDAKNNNPVLMPPSGHLAGLYARIDDQVGVWKAPANAHLRGLHDPGNGPLEFQVDQAQQDILNPRGVNAIRDFQATGRGILVWGARTMSSDPEWRYISVRRLSIYVRESLDQGMEWVVFEPNDQNTWTQVVSSGSAFLNTLWLDGGLMGASQNEAYFVLCDRSTMTQDDIDQGRLIFNVGIAPLLPAEFVILRIVQQTKTAP